MSQLPFVYGTAWKHDDTARHVSQALDAGFLAFDTAAQPKNYHEALVGQSIRAHCGDEMSKRRLLFVQTKFTPSWSQDPETIPYDATAALEDQVRDSVRRSLWNLCFSKDLNDSRNYIDAVLLHAPLKTMDETLKAWHALEEFVPSKIKQLGIANVTLVVLQRLWTEAKIKPSIVQNPFCSKSGYDIDLRAFCRRNGIMYQSYGTLTANKHLLGSPPVDHVARINQTSQEAALYALIMTLGIVVLNGTKSPSHMQSDLQEVLRIMSWAKTSDRETVQTLKSFWKLLTSNSEEKLGSQEPPPSTA